jgi:hypothetical protein
MSSPSSTLLTLAMRIRFGSAFASRGPRWTRRSMSGRGLQIESMAAVDSAMANRPKSPGSRISARNHCTTSMIPFDPAV